jgi:hypothetical protein
MINYTYFELILINIKNYNTYTTNLVVHKLDIIIK